MSLGERSGSMLLESEVLLQEEKDVVGKERAAFASINAIGID